MAKHDVNPVSGKYTIKGKNNRNLEVELDGNTNDFIVEEFDPDLDSIREKAPNIPDNIDWFACFSVYNRKNGKKSGYANVKYHVSLDASVLPSGKKLYAYYNNRVNELSYTTEGNKIKFSLNVGDPPVGIG
jgi:hypothetical protein